MLFSVAMTAGQLVGDSLVARLGDQRTLRIGGGVAVVGIAVLLLVPVPAAALSGFVLFGLGASNLVPVLFRRAGQQTVMPAAFAVSAVTTASFGGALVGPALIGFTAKEVGLATAFWLLAGLVAMLPLRARRATR
jgi:MFS family permease